MKSPALVVLTAFTLAASACATSPARPADVTATPRTFATKEEAARYLVALRSRSGAGMEGAMFAGTPTTLPMANEIRLVTSAWREKYAPQDSIASISAAAIARHLSLDELTAVINFEESPMGRRATAAQVTIATETMTAVNKLLDPHRDELQAAMQRIMMMR